MHQIIKDYVETNKSLIDLLNDESDLDQPVEKALLLIIRQMHKPDTPIETLKIIDAAIEKGHADKEVFAFFISHLIPFYVIHQMFAKSDSAYRISCSFDIASYQPEIQAVYHQSCSYYFFQKNDIAKINESILLALSKMPKKSHRFESLISNASQVLGSNGMLQDMSQEELTVLEKLATITTTTGYVVSRGILINALFTVNMHLINKYFSEMLIKFKNEAHFKKDRIKNLIAVLQGDLEEKKDLEPATNACILYYKYLKVGDSDKAKLLFVNIETEFLEGNFGIFHFFKYHHAFVTGRYEIIEKLIQNNEKQNYHYMLDFFLVRYFLIKKNQELARFYYMQLFKNCEKYHAIGRLKFEMQFAFEFSAISFFELTQPLQSVISIDISKTLEVAMKSVAVGSIGLNRIVGKSNAISEIKKKIKKFADIQRPILILGETGAGKEIVARAIHEESMHKEKPFLAINCGALTDTLLQSELFGYEAGAFTGAVHAHQGIFEAAEDGIVFMDEFGEMSHKLQVSLLRVLENNEVMRIGGTKVKRIKCRIIAATNANIEDLISKKLFREDLYHRLKQFVILIPPLRERKEDIPDLINYFLNQQSADHKQFFSNELLFKFQEYHWPGNIRELKNEIDRINVLCGYKPVIEVDDIEIEWLNKNKKSTQINPNKLESDDNRLATAKKEQIHQRIINLKLSPSDKRCQQIKELFQQYQQLTRSQVAVALEIGVLTVAKDLQRLCSEGLIVKKMPSKCPRSFYYEITVK